VLGADTGVVIADTVLGKPADRSAGIAMLQRLSGSTHEVLSAVALAGSGGEATRLSASRVTFRTLTARECAAYWATGEPADKAGAYAIQGLAAVFVSRLEGSYSGVMGLPLYETAELLKESGITVI
jgi:septum formation protein